MLGDVAVDDDLEKKRGQKRKGGKEKGTEKKRGHH
jgi:hypothetical protein